MANHSVHSMHLPPPLGKDILDGCRTLEEVRLACHHPDILPQARISNAKQYCEMQDSEVLSCGKSLNLCPAQESLEETTVALPREGIKSSHSEQAKEHAENSLGVWGLRLAVLGLYYGLKATFPSSGGAESLDGGVGGAASHAAKLEK